MDIWRSFKEWSGLHKTEDQDLNRSRYSLVSTAELTADTLQQWMKLPEEVKYDPALEPFRKVYEREHGKLQNIQPQKTVEVKKHLPLVKSAPIISSQLHVLADEDDVRLEMQKAEMSKVSLDTMSIKTHLKVQQTKHLLKMTLLLACWVFFTVIFMTCNEKHEVFRNSAIVAGQTKDFVVHSSNTDLSILLKISGPFLSEHEELKLNSSQKSQMQYLEGWIERKIRDRENSTMKEFVEKTQIWRVIMQNESQIDVTEGETRSNLFKISSNHSGTFSNVIRVRTTWNHITPIRWSYQENPLDVNTGVIYACVLLVGLYVLIIFEVINRTMAAILISTTSLSALALAGERPTLVEIISWLDVETLLLLFSMMLLVAIMAETGIFDYLAVFTFEVTKGRLWPLIFLLCGITAFVSTFLDNVTTVLLMSPVTIRLCEVMNLDPVPILMSMAMYSNIGGTATPVGDPPNVIVASNKAVVEAGINFTNFTAHMALAIFFVVLQTSLQLRFMFRDSNKLRLKVPRDIQDLRHQISIWRRAADSLPHLSKGVDIVRERLERKIKKLSNQLEVQLRESGKRACPKDTFQSTLVELKAKHKIRDKTLLVKASVATAFVVVVFFMHSVPELNRISLGWTALLGAILLLILADREDLEPILHRVEWSTLLFFAALFVLMEALSKLGLILYIGGLLEQLILMVDEKSRLAVALILILWVSGVISAFVDNIPLTTMMIRVVVSIGSNPSLNLPLPPLIWSLLLGACLGGNGTLIAASANVVCAGVAEQHGYKFTFLQFFKLGFPIMIGHLVVSSVYLLVCHCVFTWH